MKVFVILGIICQTMQMSKNCNTEGWRGKRAEKHYGLDAR
jgi:hypothetical protein